MSRYRYKLQGLSCASCAAKIERRISDLSWVQNAHVDFATATLAFHLAKNAQINESVLEKIVTDIEPDVQMLSLTTPDLDKTAEKKKLKLERAEMIIGTLFFALALASRFFPALPGFVGPVFYVLSTAVSGRTILIRGVRQALKFQLDENTLMSIAVIAATLMGEYFEGTMVALLFKIGEYLEDVAVGRSRRQIEALTEIRPDKANRLEANGQVTEINAESVSVGETIVIRPFERVPLDGIVLQGYSEVDSAALTGESVPQPVSVGSELLSGMVNQGGLLQARVTNNYGDSAASRIIEMVQSASANKAATERTITKFARHYTLVVVVIAALLALLPPLLGWGASSDWVMRSLVFLVASCPCALVISVPLGYFAAIGGASKQGILIKGGKYLEALAQTKAVAFDKTGTLTEGALEVVAVESAGTRSREALLALAAAAELHSSHPIALAIRKSARDKKLPSCKNYAERPGLGVVCETAEGQRVLVGRRRLLEEKGLSVDHCPPGDVYIAVGGRTEGSLRVADTIRPGAPAAIRKLKALGLSRLVMLTGDSEPAARRVADACGITEVHHSLFPQDKVKWMQRLRLESGNGIFVGDGINDAPVLATASCGVAMGLGAQAAIEAADLVLTSGTPDRLPDAIQLARRATRVIHFNIAFALISKFAVLILAVLGLSPIWLAVFADVGVSLLSVLNSSRLLYVRPALNS